jgi:UDP-galactopyranose mutase
MDIPKFVIIGGGFSGAVFAERVANILNEKVLIVEKREHIGGNSYDYKSEEGIFVHKYGPHIFHTDNDIVWDYLLKFSSFNNYKHKVLAYIDGKYIQLPFDFKGIEEFFKENGEKIKERLLENYKYSDKVPIYELLNSKDRLLKEIGEFVYEKIFLNYSIKQWGENPLNLSKEVLKRVPVYIGNKEGYFENRYEGIPKKGFLNLFNNMLKNKNIYIKLNKDVKELFYLKDGMIYTKENRVFEGYFIYTGPIDYLFDYKFGKLPYRSLKFEFEKIEKEFYQKAAVVNYPNDNDFTRITEYKHFIRGKSSKTIISKEFPGEYDKNSKNFNIPYYPILKEKNMEILNRYLDEAKRYDKLYLIGRLAEYRYYNMDEAILSALNLFNDRFKSIIK